MERATNTVSPFLVGMIGMGTSSAPFTLEVPSAIITRLDYNGCHSILPLMDQIREQTWGWWLIVLTEVVERIRYAGHGRWAAIWGTPNTQHRLGSGANASKVRRVPLRAVFPPAPTSAHDQEQTGLNRVRRAPLD